MRNKKKPLRVKRINLPRYTFDAWQKIFSNSNESEWESVVKPYNLFSFLISNIEELNALYSEISDCKIKVVVIDDEFFAWYDANHKENYINSLVEYMDIISDEDAERLSIKNKMNVAWSVLYYLLVAYKKKGSPNRTSYELKDDAKKIFTEFNQIKYKTSASDVYVPGYIIKCQDAVKFEPKLLDMGVSALEMNAPFRYGSMSEQKWDSHVKVLDMAIPIVVKAELDTSVFDSDVDKWPNSLLKTLMIPIEAPNGDAATDENFEKVKDSLKKIINDTMDIFEQPLTVYDMLEVRSSFYLELSDALEKKAI